MEIHGTLPESAASFRMIDVGAKPDTQRRAVASGAFFAAPQTIDRIRQRSLPKGDVLVLAEMAGIQGAKHTAELLPLCHPLPLTSVRVWSEIASDRVTVFCEAKTVGKTGVEMEALSGVNAALLCIYDLTKGIDPVLRMGEIQLEVKEGGKSGIWVQPGSPRAPRLISSPSIAPGGNLSHASDPNPQLLPGVLSVVLTLSDRCARGESQDLSGPSGVQWLTQQGACVQASKILPDDEGALRKELSVWFESSEPTLIITTGGTGLSPRDITPQALREIAQEWGGREIEGMGELLRQSGARHTRTSWLSRSAGFVIRHCVVVCLPGKPSAVVEGLNAVGDLLGHALHIAQGGGHTR